jgi:predicted nicotinamide N-methyase
MNHREMLQGCTVLELGAGCGLPGLVAATAGAKEVILTDLAVNVGNLNRNIRLNKTVLDSFDCCARSAEVEFGKVLEQDFSSLDIIIGADIGFDVALHSIIRCTLLDLVRCNKGAKILLCEEIRWNDVFHWYIEELEKDFIVREMKTTSHNILHGKRVKLLELIFKE